MAGEDIVPGTKLWYVPSNPPRPGYEVEVAKVGRVWIKLAGYRGERLDKDSLRADGGQFTSPGRAYRSRKEYEDEQTLRAAWSVFRQKVDCRNTCPEGVTLERIDQAAELLFPKEVGRD